MSAASATHFFIFSNKKTFQTNIAFGRLRTKTKCSIASISTLSHTTIAPNDVHLYKDQLQINILF